MGTAGYSKEGKRYCRGMEWSGIEQSISVGRDLRQSFVQLTDCFGTDQKLKPVTRGIVQMPVKCIDKSGTSLGNLHKCLTSLSIKRFDPS